MTPDASKHTPGPWTCSGGGFIGICAMIDGVRRLIGRAESVGHPPVIGDREVEANARVMMAAPDLLAALKEAVKSCPCTLAERDSGHLVDCFAPAALAAIAKAEDRV